MFISLLYKKKKAGREKRESGLDRLTEGPNNHVQKAIRWEDVGEGARGATKAKKNASRHRLGQAMEKHVCRSHHTDLEVIDLGFPSTDLVLPGWEQRTGDTAYKELQLSPLLHLADSQLLYKKDLSARKLAGRSFCGEAEMLLKVSQWNTASSWIQICVLNWEKWKRSHNENVPTLSALTQMKRRLSEGAIGFEISTAGTEMALKGLVILQCVF